MTQEVQQRFEGCVRLIANIDDSRSSVASPLGTLELFIRHRSLALA